MFGYNSGYGCTSLGTSPNRCIHIYKYPWSCATDELPKKEYKSDTRGILYNFLWLFMLMNEILI